MFAPLDDNLIYLNSGSHSVTPLAVLEALTREQRAYERNPTQGLFGAPARLWDVQCRLARFLGASPEDLFLRPNVTGPLNDFILRAPVEPGRRKIVLFDVEYGAILSTARLRAEREGWTVVTIPFREATAVADLERELDASTGMCIVSHVITSTGHVLPVESLARRTRSQNIRLVVDGAHAPGVLPLDFSKLGDVDYYAGNLHKWMLGPKGTAFGWVHPRRQDELPLAYSGWTTYDCAAPFDAFRSERPFARKWLMTGCYDFAPYYALHETLALWEDGGAERIRTRLYALRDLVDEHFGAMPSLRSITPRLEDRIATSAFAFPETWLAGRTPPQLMEDLRAAEKVQALFSVRQGLPYLRITPHIHNTDADIAEAARRLRRFFSV